MSTLPITRDTVIARLESFAKQHSLTIYLFGSYARGTHNPSSDIDIYIETSNSDLGYILDTTIKIKRLLAPNLEIEIDILYSSLISAKDGDYFKTKGVLIWES